MFQWLAFFFAILFVPSECCFSKPPSIEELDYSRYQIELHITTPLSSDTENKLNGIVIFVSQASNEMKEILVCTSGFKITHGTLSHNNGRTASLNIESHTPGHVKFTLPDEGKIPKGHIYVLSVHYVGALRTDETGFHKVDALNDGAHQLHYGVTGTRMGLLAFPYVTPHTDNRLARINLTVRHDLEDKVIASGEDFGLIPPLNLEFGMITQFYATAPIPPNRFGIVIGKLSHLNSYIRFRRGKFYITCETIKVAEEACKILDEMERYLHVTVPSDKIDMIVLHDLAPSVVDAWSLILIPKELDKPHERFLVVAETLSRQFFANLRPYEMKFLHFEGVGDFFKYKLLRKLFTAYDPGAESMIMESLLYALREDTPASVLSNEVAAQRAGSILRMLEESMTEPAIRDTFKSYMTMKDIIVAYLHALAINHVYNYVRSPDSWMWGKLTYWFELKGYPLLTVSISRSHGSIEFFQNGFRSSNKSHTDWPIPFWMNDTMYLATIIARVYPKPTELWTLGNISNHGYYRVNYDTTIWNAIIEKLSHPNFTDISPLNRARLIDNAMILAFSSHINFDIPFTVTKYLNQETDLLPWQTAHEHFKFLYRMTQDSDTQSKVQTAISKAVLPLIDRLGVKDTSSDSYETLKLRKIAIELAWLGQVDAFNQKVKEFTLNEVINNTGLCCVAVQLNDSLALEILRHFATVENFSVLECLTCTKHELYYALLFSTSFDAALTHRTKLQIRKLIIQNGGYEGVTATIKYLMQNLPSTNRNRNDLEHEKLIKFLASWIMHRNLRPKYFGLLKAVSTIPTEEKRKLGERVNENIKWRDVNLQKIHDNFM